MRKYILPMETPLRGHSGGHAGAAPTLSFGRIACGWLVSFGQIAHGMVDVVWVDCAQKVILFVWDVWKNITERGRGGACVPARVAP